MPLGTSGISLYYTIAEFIRNKVLNKEWPKGYKLPSEPELAQHFNVSRSTIRQAISELILNGFLERKRGVGTFVTSPIVELNYLPYLLPAKYGKRHKVLFIEKKESTPSAERYLNLRPHSIVTEICRARYIYDLDTPFLLERLFYESSLFPELESMDLTGFIYNYIIEKYKIPLIRTQTYIEPIQLTKDEAPVLNCTSGQLAQLVTRVVYTKDSRPVYFTKKIICASQFRLCIESEIPIQSHLEKR